MAEIKFESEEAFNAAVAERIAAETAGLKTNKDEVLKELKAARAKLAAYDGVDPEEHKRLKTAAEEAERKKAAAEGDFKSLEQQLVTKYEKQIAAEQAEKARYAKAMEQHLIDAAIAQELAKHSDTPKLLMPHLKAQVKVQEVDGEFVARVVDAQGTVRIGKGQGSSPMSIAELVEEMKTSDEFAPAFRGSGSSGGGASKSSGSAAGARVVPAGDNAAFLANLDGIAKGTTKVAA